MASGTLTVLESQIQPVWVNDTETNQCQLCQSYFGVILQRRHHCRACGSLICGRCTERIYSPTEFVVEPGKTQCLVHSPASLIELLQHPNNTTSSSSSYLGQLVSSLTLTTTDEKPFETVKLCSNCSLKRYHENESWNTLYALVRTMNYISTKDCDRLIRCALEQYLRDPSQVDSGMALLGRCIHVLTTSNIMLGLYTKLVQYKVFQWLMHHVFKAQKRRYKTQFHQFKRNILMQPANEIQQYIALYMNATHKFQSQDPLKLNIVSKQLESQYCAHVLLSKMLGYKNCLNLKILEDFWELMYNDQTTSNMFCRFRFFSEILFSDILETQSIQDECLNANSFTPYLQFLSKRFQNNNSMYSSTIQIILHGTVFTQPNIAEACAHALQLNIGPIEEYYSSVFMKMRHILYSKSGEVPSVKKDPLIHYKSRVGVMDTFAQCNDKNIVYYQVSKSPKGCIICVDDRYTVFPTRNRYFLNAVEMLVRPFQKIRNVVGTGFKSRPIFNIPYVQYITASRDSQEAIAYIYTNTKRLCVLSEEKGTIHETNPIIPCASNLCYVIVFIMDVFWEVCARFGLEFGLKRELPIVYMNTSTNTIAFPYTWSALPIIKHKIYGEYPLTDSKLETIQQLYSILTNQHTLEVWMAFYPFVYSFKHTDVVMKEFIAQLQLVNCQDMFRKQFHDRMN